MENNFSGNRKVKDSFCEGGVEPQKEHRLKVAYFVYCRLV